MHCHFITRDSPIPFISTTRILINYDDKQQKCEIAA